MNAQVMTMVRTLQQTIQDHLYPGKPHYPNPSLQGKRYEAIAYVLQSLPDEPYQKLRACRRSFVWFIPPFRSFAAVQVVFLTEPFANDHIESPYAAVMYLSPRLEEQPWDIVVASVAHELVHVILGHSLSAKGDQYTQQENEVFEHLCIWGYEKEAKAHRKMRDDAETENDVMYMLEDPRFFGRTVK